MNIIEIVKKLATTEQANAQLLSSYGDYVLHPESKALLKEALHNELLAEQKALTMEIRSVLIEHELYMMLSDTDMNATQEYLELATGTLEHYRALKEQLRSIEKIVRHL